MQRLQKGLKAAEAAAAGSSSSGSGSTKGEAAAAADGVPVVALGKASTQDVLRLLWSASMDGADTESGGEHRD
jgi:hypothetical protein